MNKLFKSLGLLFVLLFSYSSSVNASGNNIYTVEPVLNDQQEEGIINYVSVLTKGDGYDGDLQFRVSNRTDEPLTLGVEALNAITSPSGVIEYTNQLEVENFKLTDETYAMSNYIELEDTVELAPNETKVIGGKINVPSIEGTVLGGVSFQLFEEGQKQPHQDMSIQIHNEVTTVIGVKVDSQDVQKDEVNFSFGEPFVSQFPAYYAVRLPVDYQTPYLLSDVWLEYEVLDEKNKKLFGTETQRSFSFAPKSLTNIAFPWDSDSIQEDVTYKIKGTVNFETNEGAVEVIPFDEDFTFTGKEGWGNDNDNQRNVPKLVGELGSYWYFLLFLLLIPIVIWFVVWKRKKKEEKEEVEEDEDEKQN